MLYSCKSTSSTRPSTCGSVDAVYRYLNLLYVMHWAKRAGRQVWRIKGCWCEQLGYWIYTVKLGLLSLLTVVLKDIMRTLNLCWPWSVQTIKKCYHYILWIWLFTNSFIMNLLNYAHTCSVSNHCWLIVSEKDKINWKLNGNACFKQTHLKVSSAISSR